MKDENVTVVVPYTEQNKNTQGDTLQVVETEKPPDDVKVNVPPMDGSETQDEPTTGITVPVETDTSVTVAEEMDMVVIVPEQPDMSEDSDDIRWMYIHK